MCSAWTGMACAHERRLVLFSMRIRFHSIRPKIDMQKFMVEQSDTINNSRTTTTDRNRDNNSDSGTGVVISR